MARPQISLVDWSLNTVEALLTNVHSRKRKVLVTAAWFSRLRYKLCIFTFPWAVCSSFGHLFRVPRVPADESFRVLPLYT